MANNTESGPSIGADAAPIEAQKASAGSGQIPRNRPLQEDPKASASATVNQALTVRMGEATASPGQTVCLPILTQNFRNLIGFQFTIQWDSTLLDYQSVRSFGLPGYGPSSFGDRFASRGYLSTLWTEAALKGTSLADGTKLFELCLTNRAPSGSEVPVRFTNGPTTLRSLLLIWPSGSSVTPTA
ncbi:MAG: hypothetical protein HC821_05425 [Lewinella sp.]|nr:hypothetical protein [Lewinella sp.]